MALSSSSLLDPRYKGDDLNEMTDALFKEIVEAGGAGAGVSVQLLLLQLREMMTRMMVRVRHHLPRKGI